MSWTETHRYYTYLREIEAELDRSPAADLPWVPAHAEVFGTPERLVDALRSRWARLVQAQVGDVDPARDLAALTAAHPGLVRLLARAEVDAVLGAGQVVHATARAQA